MIADAFHYINDVIAYAIALAAAIVSDREDPPKWLTFGWQRAQLLGAFFNSIFLFSLGVNLFLQAIERFTNLQRVEQPILVVVIGAVGLALNLTMAVVAHEHDHHGMDTPVGTSDDGKDGDTPTADASSHKGAEREHDHGMLGVLLHVLGDALNNVGVVVVGITIWFAKFPHRYWADPAVGMAIALMILSSSIPLALKTSKILLDCVPPGVDIDKIEKELCDIPGIISVHELHARRLNQVKAVASVHVVVAGNLDDLLPAILKQASSTLHRHGIHSVNIQPEVQSNERVDSDLEVSTAASWATSVKSVCQSSTCGPVCSEYRCCPGQV